MTRSAATGWRLPQVAAWLAVTVLVALGIGGLVVSIDHPAGDATRSELTSRRDHAAAPAITALAGGVDHLATSVDMMRGPARDALVHAAAHDPIGLSADVTSGSAMLGSVEAAAAELQTLVGQAPAGLDRFGLSQANQRTLTRVDEALAAVTTLGTAWRQLAAIGPSGTNDAAIAVERAAGALGSAAAELASRDLTR